MSFLRGAAVEPEVWRHFRESDDHFAAWRDGAWWVVRTDAPSERTVQRFHELSALMPGTVSVALTRVRDATEWRGDDVALSDVREGIARLRVPVARTGGLMVTLWGDQRQLALSPQLSLWAWARTPAWRQALAIPGMRECPREALGDRRWATDARALSGSDELDGVTAAVVHRLGLTAATRSEPR